MFGRKRKQDEAAAEAAREAERHALFAQLSTRPEDVCPFLGLADDRVGFRDGASADHRCYAFGDPAPLSSDQQTRVCLDRGYGNCPRYLRGVLVIPTEELEALRRPAPARTPKPAPKSAPPPRRRPIAAWLIALLLLVLVGGIAGGVFLIGGLPGVAVDSPTPTVSSAATGVPSVQPTDTPTPAPPTPTPTLEPTPEPGDEFIGFEVEVAPGEYTLFVVDDQGEVLEARDARFDNQSRGEVERIAAPNGQLHWRTRGGGYDGLSYIRERSGGFIIREVYQGSDGSLRYIRLTPDQT